MLLPRTLCIAATIATPLLLPAVGAAQDASAAVDSLFRGWHTPDSPGAAVLVVHGGRTVHAKGYGMANLEHGVPVRTNTVFDIASVSKQFAALAVALLEAEGRISLDDDVRRYLPELHDFGTPITIRHLVHHTSGIRDWPGTMRIAGWDYRDVLSYEQILRLAFDQRELNFPPGSEFAYSNTGYNLLAEIVQRVSGQTFRAFTDERIFQPLDMRDTHFHDDITRVVPNRAASYGRAPDGGWRHVASGLTALGSSSLFSTVEDLAKWVANFGSGEVGGARVIERLHERGVLSGGDTIAYAFGQSITEHRGLRAASHTGSWAGYRTILQRFPDEELAIVILANTADLNTTQLAGRIADIFLADRLGPVVTTGGGTGLGADAPRGSEAARWAPSPAELRAYEGRYASSELLTAWSLTVRGGRLVARHFRTGDFALQPRALDRFESPLFGELRFFRDEAGRVAGFTANAERVRGLRFVRDEARDG